MWQRAHLNRKTTPTLLSIESYFFHVYGFTLILLPFTIDNAQLTAANKRGAYTRICSPPSWNDLSFKDHFDTRNGHSFWFNKWNNQLVKSPQVWNQLFKAISKNSTKKYLKIFEKANCCHKWHSKWHRILCFIVGPKNDGIFQSHIFVVWHKCQSIKRYLETAKRFLKVTASYANKLRLI